MTSEFDEKPHFDAPADRMLAALSAVFKGEATPSEELETAICEYVAYLRTQNLPAERVVIVIKDVLTQTGNRTGAYVTNGFVESVVTLAINEYYKDVPKRG